MAFFLFLCFFWQIWVLFFFLPGFKGQKGWFLIKIQHNLGFKLQKDWVKWFLYYIVDIIRETSKKYIFLYLCCIFKNRCFTRFHQIEHAFDYYFVFPPICNKIITKYRKFRTKQPPWRFWTSLKRGGGLVIALWNQYIYHFPCKSWFPYFFHKFSEKFCVI